MYEINTTDPRGQTNKPYDPTESIFNDFLFREKEIVADYWTGEKMPVLFRSNSDRNQTNDNSTIYYYARENIAQGTLLSVFGSAYLVLNQEPIENPIYKKSDLARCNTIISVFSNGMELVVPAFVMGLTSPYGNSNNTISVVSGNIELITQDCEISRGILPSNTFYAIGGKYSVTKTAYSDGVMHIYAKAEAQTAPPTFTLELSLKDSYAVDARESLTAVARRTEQGQTDTVTNATVIWESSDESIVVFGESGEAVFMAIGEAMVTATWKEHGITQSGIVRVVAESSKHCEITFAGAAELKRGGSAKTFTSNFYDESGELDTSIVPVWDVEPLAQGQEGNIVITEASGRTIKIQATSKTPLDTVFNLTLTDETGGYSTSIPITIVSLF